MDKSAEILATIGECRTDIAVLKANMDNHLKHHAFVSKWIAIGIPVSTAIGVAVMQVIFKLLKWS